ncbi:Killer protein [Acidithiobacillus ferriphilus]|nr:Killer protein [Acidithiobacillus ferriphilus]
MRHEALYRAGSPRGVQAALAAASPVELNHPGYRLHPLKGDLAGHWSIWVNGNWRVTFRFVGADVELVDYQDYH